MKAKKILILILICFLSLTERVPYLDKFPPSLYSDEINQGYNAYLISTTGRDEHGTYLPLALRSFGDWKPPLQTYLMIPFIHFFGLTEQAVRLPNALLGVLLSPLVYLLTKKLYPQSEKAALLAAFFVSISPWLIHQSRSAMLVLPALFFLLLGLVFFLHRPVSRLTLIASGLCLSLSIYSYYGSRLIIPLLLLVLFFLFRKSTELIKLQTLWLFAAMAVALLPLGVAYLSNQDVAFGRVKHISIFNFTDIDIKLWQLHSQDEVQNVPNYITNLYHNKKYYFGMDILRRFFSHLEGKFLFLEGDTAYPFRIPNMGVLYLIDSLFLIIGLYTIIKRITRENLLLLSLIIISLIPASLSYLTPSHNRSFNMSVPMLILVAVAVARIYKTLKGFIRYAYTTGIVLAFSFSFYYFQINYFKILPKYYASDWLYGFKEVISLVDNNFTQFDKVIFLPKTGMAYTYLAFYYKMEPAEFYSSIVRSEKADTFGFEHVTSLGKYKFYTLERNWEDLKSTFAPGELYIGRNEEIPDSEAKAVIYYPDGTPAFKLAYRQQ